MKNQISIVASYTAEPIENSLQFLIDEMGESFFVRFAPYAQVFQQLLEPDSLFAGKTNCCNIILLRIDDLLKVTVNQPSVTSKITAAEQLDVLSAQVIKDFTLAVKNYCHLHSTLLLILLTPSQDPHMQTCAQQLKVQLGSALTDNAILSVIDSNQLAEFYPVKEVFDLVGDSFGHVPYTEEYFAALATYICRYVVNISKPEKKVVVLDCDNTLWSGVCGEDGHNGVTVKGGYHYLQSFMLRQVKMGRLLCLASKNSEHDVKNVFEFNSQMLLPWGQVVASKINWQPKSENIIALAQELNLGLDSFIFIDDNPLEIAEVKAHCPQVLCIQLPQQEGHIKNMLDHVWVFDKHRYTAEDELRTRSYQDNVKRQQLKDETGSLQSFLEKLALRIDIKPLAEDAWARASQLTQRTNQFNTTTRRLDQASLLNITQADGSYAFTVRVQDRFGDYGIVGVMIAQLSAHQLMVSDFMLSCRALGKGVEHKMLSYLAKIADEQGKSKVVVNFKSTSRNQPASQFLCAIEGAIDNPDEDENFHFPVSALLDLRYKGTRGADLSAKTVTTPQSQPAEKIAAVASDQKILEVALAYNRPGRLLASLQANINRRPDIQQSYSKPKEGMETTIASIWRRVLRLDKIGRDDSFVDLGGNSLMLVKIHSLLLQYLGVDLPITALFKYASVAALASHIRQGDDSKNRLEAARRRAIKTRAVNLSHG